MTNYETTVANDLLNIGAVTLSPQKPYTWASGLKSPIYTDNRLTIAYPIVRTHIADGLADLIRTHYPQAEVIAGTATAGIPHAAWVAERLNLPMVYIRSKPKDHGQGRQIEGRILAGAHTVVIDDLISTGGSVLKAVAAARKAGADVVGVAGIFSYQLPAATKNFADADVTLRTLTNYGSLITAAEAAGAIESADVALLHRWREDPEHWLD
ncbi:orotate phosphoribosyltransferase [Lacticaseibacillus zhaodongensis]|uniref:orotate phosphoribosyltransferase n=1 Tax=Lacticaseibacillus zhaodongensis TaxID=2668065 RepID=UPI0012D3457E|nr:orotate phosphoribosyltransferase [Lacticaseibacillus zhaodongensis]